MRARLNDRRAVRGQTRPRRAALSGAGGEAVAQVGELCVQLLRETVAERREMLLDTRELGLPAGDVDREQRLEVGRGELEVLHGQRARGREQADRRLDGS